MTRTINITPTNEGFANIARAFADSIIGDVPKARQPADRALLQQVIVIAAALGQRGEIEAVNALAHYVDPTYLPR